MNFPKFLAIASFLLFTIIGLLALVKNGKTNQSISKTAPIVIPLEREIQTVHSSLSMNEKVSQNSRESPIVQKEESMLPERNRIAQLFNKGDTRLPFIETIIYKSRVGWLKGRPAWLSDYASYYNTSRHFIARSLNGKPDYFRQEISEGDSFNVFRKDKDIEFYLVIDISRCKMWFYAIDRDDDKRILLKTYRVGLGRLDGSRTSGLLTPLGKYKLGSKVAIYRPEVEGYYQGKKVEMVRIFGSRWIPFEKEVSECTSLVKGLGLHGVPWISSETGSFSEDTSSIGKYESDGCIRLTSQDIEELFAILITKPTTVELVKDFFDAKLPGKESDEEIP